jgi:dolichyl-diphosphooligosaccharide--protein glycosyltransferase
MRARPLRLVLAVLALSLCALWLRIDNEVLVDSGPVIQFTVQGDPYYHMRRIAYTVARFPASLEFDRYVSFPAGGQIAWTPAFDWSIAAVARAFVGPDDERAVERLAARAPAWLGLATVLAVTWLARRRFSPAAGWIAGGLLAVLPVHQAHSKVGQLDHHVAVALAFVGLLALSMALARARGRTTGRALALGLGFAGGLHLWPGMLMHVAILEALLSAWVLRAEERAQAVARARALALANAAAWLGTAPFCMGRTWTEFGSFSPWVLSDFQPTFFAGAAATLALVSAAWAHGAAAATRPRRVALAAGIGAVGLAAAFAALEELAGSLLVGAGWFTRAEAFQQEVGELLPLDPEAAVEHFSLLFLGFPLALAWLAWHDRRERACAERWIVLGSAAVFLPLALLQQRFANDLSVPFALVWGWFLAEAVPRGRAALAQRGRARQVAVLAAAVAVWLVADSLLAYHVPRQRTLARARSDRARAALGPLDLRHRLVDAGSLWLGRHSPPTSGWLDPATTPEYGVLCAWDAGHMMRYRARRPVVQDNFGVYGGRARYEAAFRYYAAEDELAAVAILRDLGVRYVLADRYGAGTLRPYPVRSMTGRLTSGFGSLQEGSAGGIPALQHHRLLWHGRAGRELELAAPAPGFALGVWEIVAGVRVVGLAEPGARVDASLALRTEAGRPHVHRTATRANAAGRFELVLPYPTAHSPGSAVQAEGPWRIESSGRVASLELSEEAVRAGATVAISLGAAEDEPSYK